MSLSKRLISTDAAGGIDGTANFAPVLYTGNGGTNAISSLNFTPDLVWIKNRDTTGYEHFWFDSVRGAGGNKSINSDSTNKEGDENTAAHGFLSSFDSNGFTLVAGTSSAVTVNNNGDDYVAWCWKAAASTTTIASGTNGSNVISNVRANTESGFSIVKFGALGAANSIVSHGLSSTPELIIYKNLDTADNWYVYTSATGLGKYLNLNTNGAVVTNASNGFTSVNSNTFTVNLTTNADDTVAYCFHSVAGYQKIGSYTGNGNSTGTVVTTGFRPRFVMIKSTDQTGDWIIVDSTRNPSNPADKRIDANSAGQEQTDTIMDLNSDGFQLKTSSAAKNGLNKVFIYLAIA